MTTPTADSLDVACLDCDYDLRGLDRAGLCPECGTPIELSCQRQLLEQQNPYSLAAGPVSWRRTFRLGLWLMVTSAVTQVMIAAVGHVADAFNWDPRLIYMLPVRLIGITAVVALIVGIILALPRRSVPSRPLRWIRLGLRLAAWVTLGWVVLLFAVALSPYWQPMEILLIGLYILSAILSLGCWLYWSVYFGRSRLRRWMWLMAVLTLLASTAPRFVNSIAVAANHYFGTFGLPAVGCIDALFIVGRSFAYQPRLDAALVVYSLSGLTGVASITTLAIAARRVEKATADFRDLH